MSTPHAFGAFTSPEQPWLQPPDSSSSSSSPPTRVLLVVDGRVPVMAAPGGGAVALVYAAAAPPGVSSDLVPVSPGVAAADVSDAAAASAALELLPADAATTVPPPSAGGAVSWLGFRDLIARGAAAFTPEVEAAFRAVALLAWHRSARFSGADGTPTASAAGGRRRRTAGPPARTLYPRVDPVAIVLVESADGERCLLGRQARWPPGMFSCVAGFCESGESAENAAVREVFEETRVRCAPARLVASQPWPVGRSGLCELMLGCVARALAEPGAEDVDVSGGGVAGAGGGELSEAKWFSRAQLRELLARAPGEGGAERPVAPSRLAIAHALMRRWADGALA